MRSVTKIEWLAVLFLVGVLGFVIISGSKEVDQTPTPASMPAPVAVQPQVVHHEGPIVNTFVHYGATGKAFISPWSDKAEQISVSTNVYSPHARTFIACKRIGCAQLIFLSNDDVKGYLGLQLKPDQRVTYASLYYINRSGSQAVSTSPNLGKPVPISITRTIRGSIEHLRLGYADIEIHDPGRSVPAKPWITDGSCTSSGCG